MLRLPHPHLCDLTFYYSSCHSLAPANHASMLFFWIHQNSCLIAIPLAVHSTWNFLQIAIMITASPPSDFAQMTTSWWSFACPLYLSCHSSTLSALFCLWNLSLSNILQNLFILFLCLRPLEFKLNNNRYLCLLLTTISLILRAVINTW